MGHDHYLVTLFPTISSITGRQVKLLSLMELKEALRGRGLLGALFPDVGEHWERDFGVHTHKVGSLVETNTLSLRGGPPTQSIPVRKGSSESATKKSSDKTQNEI